YHEPNAFAYKLRRLRLEHFECDNNILWHQGGSVLISLDDKPRTFQEWQQLGFDLHSLVADPKFVDPAKDDYRLQPDSPAFQLSFQPIPVEKIGPYADSLRASWPIQEAPGVREMSYK
ncbi:MAG TPA: hypothetical protein PKI05_12090, partial [Thermogutta sp.]|nr:hypothetical protein [Thermogutta sp.]